MLYTIQNSFEEIEGAVIGDFGCGCGMLSIASQILGAGYETDTFIFIWINESMSETM
jgi:predicted RNA methylase